MVVKNLQSVAECIAFIANQLGQRMGSINSDISSSGANDCEGDCLVVTRSMEDALLAHSQLCRVVRDLGGKVDVRLIGPVQKSVGTLRDAKRRKFDSGMIFSQTLESYSRDSTA